MRTRLTWSGIKNQKGVAGKDQAPWLMREGWTRYQSRGGQIPLNTKAVLVEFIASYLLESFRREYCSTP